MNAPYNNGAQPVGFRSGGKGFEIHAPIIANPVKDGN
jgi:hypothetical protein